MMKQALGTAVAAVFATAIAGAQAPAQSQQEPQDYQAGQHMVTVEGCLQEAQVADATRDDDPTFLLVNAQVQPAAGAVSEAAPTDPVTGTRGEAGAQAERPIGTSGAAEAAAMSATKFRVAGLDEERLEQYAGQRVRIQGEIQHTEERGVIGAERPGDNRPEADRPTADPTGTAGTTGTPESPTTGVSPQGHITAAGDAPKLKATSIHPVAGSCPDAPAAR